MNQSPVVNIELYIPDQFFELLREELNKVHVGHIGNYDNWISIITIRAYWRPLVGANPYNGEIGKVSEGTESKVEVNCNWEDVENALRVIRRIHPYDEPLINIVPLLNHLFQQEKPD